MTTGETAPRPRRYRSTDATACSAVVDACLPEMEGMNDAARAFLRARNDPERLHEQLVAWHTVVVERTGRVVAFGSLDGREVKRVYVHPDVRRGGLGSLVTDTLECEARYRGVGAVQADAPPSSIAFWQARGYVAEQEFATHNDERELRFVRMRKVL
jgi:GNAT superfamily N-acetyltransferase